ncbi:hypothetical protein HAU32_09420 [Weissella confusa]|uniref:SIR2 family protein n=1 Tax=Weissella fermenti TaxID=2987699 RepID=A0ABT6D821_9LACO|nr:MULTISPECIES: SIR2 family protein [Weissella]MBJ7689183.1 hypothetical protein [Weissella confusa]MDF9300798.1 SIR2 family protein [Weissella sp. BK2]
MVKSGLDDANKYLLYQGEDQNEIDEIKVASLLNEYLTANINLSVLLGSGSSILSIPIMGTTFKEYKNQLVGTEKDNLEYLMGRYIETKMGASDSNVENIELFLSWLSARIEGMAEAELIKGENKIKDDLIQKLLLSVKSGYYDEVNGRVTNNSKKSLPLYRDFISKLVTTRANADDSHDVVNIFTPNYDLYVEKALDEVGLPYTDGFRSGLESEFNIAEYGRRVVDTTKRYRDKWSTVSPFFRVYKLHGSLNWQKDSNGRVKKVYGMGNGSEELLIAPTSSKYADTQGFPFSDLFRELSVEMLKPNTVLLINGYGFGDEHINNFLIQALGRPDFTMIAFIEPTAQQLKFVESVKGRFGAIFVSNAKNPNYNSLNPDEDGNWEYLDNKAHYFSSLIKFMNFGLENEGE